MRSADLPPQTSLPLLCALGHHKTDGLARWNAGYYFARCARCRHDLIRTAFTRWQIPKGFRVVWDGGSSDDASNHQADEAPSRSAGRQVEFPIGENPPAPPVEQDPDIAEPHAWQVEEIDEPEEPSDFVAPWATTPDMPIHDVLRSLRGDPAGNGAPDQQRPEQSEAALFADDDGEVMVTRPHDAEFASDEAHLEEAELGEAGRKGAEMVEAEAKDFQADERIEEHPREAEAEVEKDDDFAQVPEHVAPPPPDESRYPVVPDFMDDSPTGIAWDAVSGRIVPRVRPGAAEPDMSRDSPGGVLGQGWQDLVRKRAQASPGLALFRDFRTRKANAFHDRAPTLSASPAPAPVQVQVQAPTGRAVQEPNPAAERTLEPVEDQAQASIEGRERPAIPRMKDVGGFMADHAPIIAAAVFGALVIAAAIVDGRNAPAETIVYRDPPIAPAAVSRPVPRIVERAPVQVAAVPAPRAYVTASLLNCRAAPDEESETVRRLRRGAAVDLLGSRIGWFSIAHQGQQCWAYRDYISMTRPS